MHKGRKRFRGTSIRTLDCFQVIENHSTFEVYMKNLSKLLVRQPFSSFVLVIALAQKEKIRIIIFIHF